MTWNPTNKEIKDLSKALLGRQYLNGTKFVCTHCGHASELADEAWANFGTRGTCPEIESEQVVSVGGARCAGCNGLVVVATVKIGATNTNKSVPLWPPNVRPDCAPQGLDANVTKSYSEARSVLALSPQAAALLARSCLQHMIRTKLKIKRNRLFDEIAEALRSDELSKNTRDSLDHIRTIGNWAAHPETDQANAIIEVTSEEASYTLDVLELLFDDLYTKPAKVAAMHSSIGKKKAAETARPRSEPFKTA